MARPGKRSTHRNAQLSAKTCDPRFLLRRYLYLHMIRQIKGSIMAMIYQTPCTCFLFSVEVFSSQFFLSRRPTSMSSSSASLTFWASRLVLSTMYHFESGHLDARSLIRLMQRLIRRSHRLGLVPCLLMMLMDWGISHMRALTILSIRCAVNPPALCPIPMVSAAHWPTPTLVFLAQTWTCRVGIWIVSATATTNFSNQKASHDISGSGWWSMIEWWITNACYSKQASEVLDI